MSQAKMVDGRGGWRAFYASPQ